MNRFLEIKREMYNVIRENERIRVKDLIEKLINKNIIKNKRDIRIRRILLELRKEEKIMITRTRDKKVFIEDVGRDPLNIYVIERIIRELRAYYNGELEILFRKTYKYRTNKEFWIQIKVEDKVFNIEIVSYKTDRTIYRLEINGNEFPFVSKYEHLIPLIKAYIDSNLCYKKTK